MKNKIEITRYSTPISFSKMDLLNPTYSSFDIYIFPLTWKRVVGIILLLLPLFVSFENNLLAQNTLNGMVVDGETAEPLIGANLLLIEDFSKGSQTDIDGKFSLALPESKGTLIISYIGYEDLTLPFENIGENLVIKMMPAATTIDVVVVKGDKLTGQVFAVEKIGQLDIYLNPSSQADALKAVQSNPASTTIDETANVSLRGSPASETGVFLNNVPLNDVVRLDQNNGVGQFSIFNTSTIESVSVFASNPPLEFGNATSGVVALYTNDELPEKSNSISLNLVGIGGSISRKIGQKTSFAAFSNWNTSTFLKQFNKTALSDLSTFKTIDFGLYGVHQFNENWQLKFFNYAIDESFQFQLRFPEFEDAFQQSKQRNLTILNLIQQKEKTRFEWNQGINVSDANYQVGNLDINAQNFDYFSGLNYAWYPENGSVKVGLNANVHKIASDGFFPQFFHAAAHEHPQLFFAQKDWLFIPEAFIYTKWTFKDNFSIGGGGRFHPNVDGLESYTSYQLNLAYTIKENHHLIGSFGAYNKFQLPDDDGNVLQKLFSRQYSLDYQGKWQNWKWSAAVYQKDNVRGDTPNLVQGVELFTAFDTRKIKWGISLASIQSTLENDEGNFPSEHDLSYFLRSTFSYSIKDLWSIGLVYWQRQGRYYLPVSQSIFHEPTNTYIPVFASQNEGQRLPDYYRMDISISRIIGLPFGSAVVYANANNVLDFKNVRDFNYNEDYSEQFAEYLNRRVLFFGLILNFE